VDGGESKRTYALRRLAKVRQRATPHTLIAARESYRRPGGSIHSMHHAATKPLYECQHCGVASIAVPNPLTAYASVHCGRCGIHIGTWEAFRVFVERIIQEERTLRCTPEVGAND
jgi:hypothetical protein